MAHKTASKPMNDPTSQHLIRLQLLTNGYIREITESLQSTHIIPIDIIQICIDYASKVNLFIFYLLLLIS